MNTVWLTVAGYHDEGERVLSVFTDEHSAEEECQRVRKSKMKFPFDYVGIKKIDTDIPWEDN